LGLDLEGSLCKERRLVIMLMRDHADSSWMFLDHIESLAIFIHPIIISDELGSICADAEIIRPTNKLQASAGLCIVGCQLTIPKTAAVTCK